MTGNEYQKLAMRTNDRMPKERISGKLDLLEFCKSKLKARYPQGFDIERANHRAKGDV